MQTKVKKNYSLEFLLSVNAHIPQRDTKRRYGGQIDRKTDVFVHM